jgi:hypothetical protein
MVCVVAATVSVSAQEPAASKPAEKASAQQSEEKEKTAVKPELPFQIELLETHIRFEASGDSRKEVHTVVKIINILGARQFARLSFDYNRAFQQVEIPEVRVSHANGGTSEVLPSAVTDAANPAVEAFVDFHDVRVKSVRILGLQEGDTVEYRVITTTTHHPLAPDFWLEHTFDRSGQVLREIYELDLPGHWNSTTHNPERSSVHAGVPWTNYRNVGAGANERSVIEWKIEPDSKASERNIQNGVALPDIFVSTSIDSFRLAEDLAAQIPKWSEEDKKAAESWLMIGGPPPVGKWQKLQLSYNLVSSRLATVNLPLEATGFRLRSTKRVLESGYATPEEKCNVLLELARAAGLSGEIVFYGDQLAEITPPRPAFQKVFVVIQQLVNGQEDGTALDPSIEVAPFGVISAQYRGKKAMSLRVHNGGDYGYNWIALPENLPFPSRQEVNITADIDKDGRLKATVKYTMRGDNELLLRLAFHQTPKEKWSSLANLLAISDGFRGEIVSTNASDPTATKDPFTVEYELTQSKFVDWSKKPVRVPALLPQISVPDPVSVAGASGGPTIELGTPLEVQTTVALHLPPGIGVETPPGTSVLRDYATFTSKYSSTQNTVTASRHITFLKRSLPGDRVADYSAFVHAVQSDQIQRLTFVSSQ